LLIPVYGLYWCHDEHATINLAILVTTAPDREFMGHPNGEWASFEEVPEVVALAFDLANSRDARRFHPHSARQGRRDLLTTPAELVAWLRYRGLPVNAVTSGDLDLTRRVRDAIRLVAEANTDATGREAAGAALASVVEELPLRLAMNENGSMRLEGIGTGVRPILAELLAGAADGSTREIWSRLKMCAAEDCRWVFYDRSKPRTGRWCSMAVCGSRLKTREYRRRRAACSS
jgi:predicted RNA-binding Zn ribbon-like protein